jgi:glycosyltransferase involved in cell wall biosynthesis
MTPWGVDDTVFQNLGLNRATSILTTGWCCEGEAISECFRAASQCRKPMVNLGADFRFGEGFNAFSRLTDGELCRLYNRCEFVSGLRFNEGFEMPVVEGLACGCRPICFDLPIYRKWFEGCASFIPHCRGQTLVKEIEKVIRAGSPGVSERDLALSKANFSWKIITGRFWRRMLDYV